MCVVLIFVVVRRWPASKVARPQALAAAAAGGTAAEAAALAAAPALHRIPEQVHLYRDGPWPPLRSPRLDPPDNRVPQSMISYGLQ